MRNPEQRERRGEEVVKNSGSRSSLPFNFTIPREQGEKEWVCVVYSGVGSVYS